MEENNEKLGAFEELYKLSSGLSSPLLSYDKKQEFLNAINMRYVQSDCNDAGGGNYVSLKSSKNDASLLQLPNLENSHFRKGYSIMAWIRPNEGISNLDASNNNAILYRLSNGDKFGVITTLKQLKYNKESETLSCQIQVQTFTSKIQNTTSSSSNGFPSHTSPVTFMLPTNKFSLLTISHTHPYLKKPQIFITINYQTQVQYDLAYPFSNQNSSSKSNHTENNLFLTNNVMFKNMPIDCSMLSLYKEPLFKDESDNIFSNLLSDAGASAAILLCKAGIMVPPVPPQKDANVESFSNTKSATVASSSSSSPPSSSSFSRRNTASATLNRHTLGSPIAVHPKSIDLQNYLSRSLIVLYDFETIHTLTQESKIFSPPCLIKNIGAVENVNWITSPTLQRRNSGERHRLSKGVGEGGLITDNVTSFSVYISGSESKQIQSSLNFKKSSFPNSFSSRSLSKYSSQLSSNFLYTSGLLLSLILPYHLALFPQEEQRHFLYERLDKGKAPSPLQPKLQAQREVHLNDLLANQGQYAMNILLSIANILEVSWFCREEALQTGLVYSIATYTAKLLESIEVNDSLKHDDKVEILNNLEKGLLQIIEVCCGKPGSDNSVRRTSDLALTCVIGLGLNFRILSYFSTSALSKRNSSEIGERRNLVLEQIATGYQSFGDILREYYSPQTLLDQIQIYFPSIKNYVSKAISNHFELLLKVLLQSSLSSSTHILRSEVDIQACVQALTNAKLGSLISRMVLRTFNSLQSRRLARNLWIGEYPKVIAPVLLSRSVIGGDETNTYLHDHPMTGNGSCNEWREEWRSAFELYLVSKVLV